MKYLKKKQKLMMKFNNISMKIIKIYINDDKYMKFN